MKMEEQNANTDKKNKELDEIVKAMTLKFFNVGSKHINYHILETLPTNVGSIMNETGLTKVPVNQRLNELEKCGLVRRDKGTGNVYSTELTNLFMSLVSNLETHVNANLPSILPNLIRK